MFLDQQKAKRERPSEHRTLRHDLIGDLPYQSLCLGRHDTLQKFFGRSRVDGDVGTRCEEGREEGDEGQELWNEKTSSVDGMGKNAWAKP
jgi:hypothetical protein